MNSNTIQGTESVSAREQNSMRQVSGDFDDFAGRFITGNISRASMVESSLWFTLKPYELHPIIFQVLQLFKKLRDAKPTTRDLKGELREKLLETDRSQIIPFRDPSIMPSPSKVAQKVRNVGKEQQRRSRVQISETSTRCTHDLRENRKIAF